MKIPARRDLFDLGIFIREILESYLRKKNYYPELGIFLSLAILILRIYAKSPGFLSPVFGIFLDFEIFIPGFRDFLSLGYLDK